MAATYVREATDGLSAKEAEAASLKVAFASCCASEPAFEDDALEQFLAAIANVCHVRASAPRFVFCLSHPSRLYFLPASLLSRRGSLPLFSARRRAQAPDKPPIALRLTVLSGGAGGSASAPDAQMVSALERLVALVNKRGGGAPPRPSSPRSRPPFSSTALRALPRRRPPSSRRALTRPPVQPPPVRAAAASLTRAPSADGFLGLPGTKAVKPTTTLPRKPMLLSDLPLPVRRPLLLPAAAPPSPRSRTARANQRDASRSGAEG